MDIEKLENQCIAEYLTEINRLLEEIADVAHDLQKMGVSLEFEIQETIYPPQSPSQRVSLRLAERWGEDIIYQRQSTKR